MCEKCVESLTVPIKFIIKLNNNNNNNNNMNGWFTGERVDTRCDFFQSTNHNFDYWLLPVVMYNFRKCSNQMRKTKFLKQEPAKQNSTARYCICVPLKKRFMSCCLLTNNPCLIFMCLPNFSAIKRTVLYLFYLFNFVKSCRYNSNIISVRTLSLFDYIYQ